jgi:hypothetical protein
LLVLLGLVLAPTGIPNGAPVMAMTRSAMAMSHPGAALASVHPCTQKQRPSDKASHDCCVMACVAIPAAGGELIAQMVPTALPPPLLRAGDPHGAGPEAETPPPRFS